MRLEGKETGRAGHAWSSVLVLPREAPQPSDGPAPSAYQVPVAAHEGAGHLPEAGPPGRGWEVGRSRHWVWGASVRKTWLRGCPGPLGPPQGGSGSKTGSQTD